MVSQRKPEKVRVNSCDTIVILTAAGAGILTEIERVANASPCCTVLLWIQVICTHHWHQQICGAGSHPTDMIGDSWITLLHHSGHDRACSLSAAKHISWLINTVSVTVCLLAKGWCDFGVAQEVSWSLARNWGSWSLARNWGKSTTKTDGRQEGLHWLTHTAESAFSMAVLTIRAERQPCHDMLAQE